MTMLNLSTLQLVGCGIALLVSFLIFKSFRSKSPYEHIPGPPSKTSAGFLLDMHDPDSLESYHYPMCDNYGHTVRLSGGFFGLQGDALYLSDPQALNSVLVRDQNNFPESREFVGLFGIIHKGDGLASLQGREHKKMRMKVNPVFTADHVAKMTPIFYDIARQLRDTLDAQVREYSNGRQIDVLDYLRRTALELISQGGLGHSFDSFKEDSPQFLEFNEALSTVLPTASDLFIVLPYFDTWRKMKPVWLRRFLASLVDYVPWPSARKFKWGAETMQRYCKWLYTEKQKIIKEQGIAALENTPTGGKDLTSLLMLANAQLPADQRMPDDIVIANMSAIVLAGQETTSGALSRLLHYLVEDIKIQTQLRDELNDAIFAKGGDLEYNELNSLPLLDAVTREILRLYPPVTFIWRDCTEDTVVPLHFPVVDPRTGAKTKTLLIKKGTSVYAGIGAANRSKAIWGPDAADFKPERWLTDERQDLDAVANGIKMPAIFSNSMTFLGGGRACPGMKFSLLEMKIVLAVLLPHFTLAPPKEEILWNMGISIVPLIKGQKEKGPAAPLVMKVNRDIQPHV